VILDSNVLIALFQREQADLFDRISRWRRSHAIRINLVIYAECAPSFASDDGLRLSLNALGIGIEDLTLPEGFRAGQAYAEYKRRGGEKQTILPDFLIGAQAELRGWPLVTRDRKGFASYFPDLQVIDPTEDL